MSDFLTYNDISDKISAAIGDLNETRTAEIQSVINMVYLDEIMVCDDLYPLHWIMDLIDNVKTGTAATITGITKADPGVVTAASHGRANGDIVQFGAITGMTELNYRMAVVTNKAANTFELYDLAGNKINTTAYGAAGTAGIAHHRGVTLGKNFTKIHSFGWHGYNGQVKPISAKEIETSASWMDTGNTSRPARHLHKQHFTAAGVKADRLIWYPLPDTTGYQARIWGELDVSPMSGATDAPMLPFRFHNAIVAGSIARLVQYGGVQVENAVIWPALYRAQIEAIKTYNRAYWKQFGDERSGIFLL